MLMSKLLGSTFTKVRIRNLAYVCVHFSYLYHLLYRIRKKLGNIYVHYIQDLFFWVKTFKIENQI